MNTKIIQTSLLLTVLVAAATMLLSGAWFSYTSDIDSSTFGLVSVNISQGERPLFFYGQPFFGALESYLGALYISLLGFSEFALSLAPISFTLGWIVFSFLLFSRIQDGKAGLIAAVCTAFSGCYIFWYSIGTFGYSAIFCLGTAVLWLSLRILQEGSQGYSLCIQGALVGILMGLGIWVHPLSFPYIGTALTLFALHTIRVRFSSVSLITFAIVILLALAGFIPYFLETGNFFGGMDMPVDLTEQFIKRALVSLITVNTYGLMSWDIFYSFPDPIVETLVTGVVSAVLLAGAVLALYGFMPFSKTDVKRINYLVPLLFCLFFVTMYVQHHMAVIKAPRYAISFWIMLLCSLWSLAIVGQKSRKVKGLAILALGIWVSYQVTGTVMFIISSKEVVQKSRQAMEDIVQAVHKNDLKSVLTYGDFLFGLQAQKLNMYSGNKVIFAHADEERYWPNAQVTETDMGRGYLTRVQNRESLEAILTDIGAAFTVEKIHSYFLYKVQHVQPRYDMQIIPAREIKLIHPTTVNAKLLFDRSQDAIPEYEVIGGKTIIVDTGKNRQLCGLWMFSTKNPYAPLWKNPGQYDVFVSQDNIDYQHVYASSGAKGNGYHAGPQIFIGGPWGRAETFFAPNEGRYVKIVFAEPNEFSLSELFLFESAASIYEYSDEDITKLAQYVLDNNLDFVLADRWVSARLREVLQGKGKRDITLARHSNKFVATPYRYFILPGMGQALVCEKRIADYCETMLQAQYGNSVIKEQIGFRNYSIFNLSDAELKIIPPNHSALLWNGHLPIQTSDMKLLVPWYREHGLPVWKPEYQKSEGFYDDSWTNGKGILFDLDYRIKKKKDKKLVVYTTGEWQPSNTMDSVKLQVVANGAVQLPFKEQREGVFFFNLPETLTKLKTLELRSSVFTPPGKDPRTLGVHVQLIEVQ